MGNIDAINPKEQMLQGPIVETEVHKGEVGVSREKRVAKPPKN